MKQEEAKSIFTLAGIEVLRMEPLIDGYNYDPSDERYFKELPRQVWWFVKTRAGWVKIGWRKRVIAIDWRDTEIKASVTTDDVTKDETSVHACSVEDAIIYLRALAFHFDLEAAYPSPL